MMLLWSSTMIQVSLAGVQSWCDQSVGREITDELSDEEHKIFILSVTFSKQRFLSNYVLVYTLLTALMPGPKAKGIIVNY